MELQRGISCSRRGYTVCVYISQNPIPECWIWSCLFCEAFSRDDICKGLQAATVVVSSRTYYCCTQPQKAKSPRILTTHRTKKTDAMKTEEERRSSSRDRSHPPDTRLPPPLIPVDFGYWKLAPPALGLLSLGVYAGFRKQVRCHVIDKHPPGLRVAVFLFPGNIVGFCNRDTCLAATQQYWCSVLRKRHTRTGTTVSHYMVAFRSALAHFLPCAP